MSTVDLPTNLSAQRTEAVMKTGLDTLLLRVKEMLGASVDPTLLTISTGSVVASLPYHTVNGAAGLDTLSNITTTTLRTGAVLILRATGIVRVETSAGGAGQIIAAVAGMGSPILLNGDHIILQLLASGNWQEIATLGTQTKSGVLVTAAAGYSHSATGGFLLPLSNEWDIIVSQTADEIANEGSDRVQIPPGYTGVRARLSSSGIIRNDAETGPPSGNAYHIELRKNGSTANANPQVVAPVVATDGSVVGGATWAIEAHIDAPAANDYYDVFITRGSGTGDIRVRGQLQLELTRG